MFIITVVITDLSLSIAHVCYHASETTETTAFRGRSLLLKREPVENTDFPIIPYSVVIANTTSMRSNPVYHSPRIASGRTLHYRARRIGLVQVLSHVHRGSAR